MKAIISLIKLLMSIQVYSTIFADIITQKVSFQILNIEEKRKTASD